MILLHPSVRGTGLSDGSGKTASGQSPEFDVEVSKWVDQGILVRHDHHTHGEV